MLHSAFVEVLKALISCQEIDPAYCQKGNNRLFQVLQGKILWVEYGFYPVLLSHAAIDWYLQTIKRCSAQVEVY